MTLITSIRVEIKLMLVSYPSKRSKFNDKFLNEIMIKFNDKMGNITDMVISKIIGRKEFLPLRWASLLLRTL